MKKFFIILCSTIIVLFGALVLSKWIANIVTDRLDTNTESEHFKIYYNLSDEKAIPDIKNRLEENYERITTDLKQKLNESVEVRIYPNLESFHRAAKVHSGGLFWWTATVSDWVVGTANGRIIRMVSPINPGNSGHTYDGIVQVAVHEFTHVVSSKINTSGRSIPVLSEGIATFESGQVSLLSVNSDLLPDSLEEMFSWNSSNNYSKMYSCGGSFVAFIVENYGYDKFIELYKRDYTNNFFDEGIRQIYDNWILKIKSI